MIVSFSTQLFFDKSTKNRKELPIFAKPKNAVVAQLVEHQLPKRDKSNA